MTADVILLSAFVTIPLIARAAEPKGNGLRSGRRVELALVHRNPL